MSRKRFSFPAIYAFLILSLVVAQVGMGADIPLVLVLALIAAATLLPLTKDNIAPGDCIYIGLSLYCGGFALLTKTLLGQPVDSNLIAPEISGLHMLVAFASITAAYLLAQRFTPKLSQPAGVFRYFNSPFFLKNFSRFGFVVGAIFHILHLILRPRFINGTGEQTAGFGGFGSFYFLIVMAFAAQIALCKLGENKARERTIATFMFVAILLMTVAGNVKKDILDALVILAISTYALGFKVGVRQVVAGAILLFAINFVLTPLIHITRSSGADFSISERFQYTAEVVSTNNFDLGKINDINDRITQGFRTNYRAFGSYVYPSTVNLDRFSLIFPLDQVVRTGGPPRIMPNDIVNRVLQIVLPSSLITKSPGSMADLVGWSYGFRAPGTVSRPVVGLPASSVALGGLFGAAIIPFGILSVVFTLLNWLGGSLKGNPWAIALTVSLMHIPEKEVDALFGIMLREAPLILIVMALFIHTMRSQRRVKALAR
jgi:hypothetical protein